MDIQKEIELYKKYRGSKINNFGLQLSDFKNLDEYLGFLTWLNAKAEAAPEGFVLVPKCKSESFSQELDNYLDDLRKSGNAFDDGFVSVNEISHDKIWSLVIKAQEQSHDE